MRPRARIVLALALWLAGASLAEPANILGTPYVFFQHESITVSTTSIGLTAATYTPRGQLAARYAYLRVEGNPIRCYFDGTTADSSGTLFNVGDSLEINGFNNMSLFLCVRSGGSDGTLRVHYAR